MPNRILPALCLTVLVLPAVSSAAELIRIGGSGGALGSMRLIAAAYEELHPGTTVEILPSLGSSGAVKGIAKGWLDVGLTSRPLTPEEKMEDVEIRRYGVTPLVFAAPEPWPAGNVTAADLVAIYGGAMKTTPSGERLRLVLRPRTDSDMKVLAAFSRDMDRALSEALGRRAMTVALTDQEAVGILERTPHGFGTTTLALVASERRALHLFSFNGVAPSLENIDNGSYPLKKALYAVVSRGAESQVSRFLDFLFSLEARRILRETGILPAAAGGER